jgi:uncharacterized membrane protein SpoIIM required for sporulation
LIGLGSTAAISGVFNICAIALDWSYCIPILCKLMFGKFEPGPWHMGIFSKFVNAWACLWTLFVSIIFILPTVRPVAANTVSSCLRLIHLLRSSSDLQQMNYASVFLVFILGCAAIFWYISGRRYYSGPVIEAQAEEYDSNGEVGEIDGNEKATDV